PKFDSTQVVDAYVRMTRGEVRASPTRRRRRTARGPRTSSTTATSPLTTSSRSPGSCAPGPWPRTSPAPSRRSSAPASPSPAPSTGRTPRISRQRSPAATWRSRSSDTSLIAVQYHRRFFVWLQTVTFQSKCHLFLATDAFLFVDLIYAGK
ncbi:unnamed protein product, partial [Musa hybrid cultivar]